MAKKDTRSTMKTTATAFIMLAAISTVNSAASSTCPSQPWNTKCNKCCEQGWLACTCASTGLMTGYPVPCCRRGKTCPPCVDYPGCNVFDNCKTCHVNSLMTYRVYDGETRFCSSCFRGWSGNDCKTCGGILKEKRGSIEIENYPNDVECVWTIDVTRNSLIELRFERFSLEVDALCAYDALTLYDGAFLPDAKSKTFCGITAPQRFVSKTHVLVLHFKADETSTHGGFRATYRELNACARRPCLNGGACMLTTSTNFVCVCTLGFSGILCERVIRCRLPPLSPYLTYTLGANGLIYGAMVKYGCDRDFFPLGTSDAYCKANGKWTEKPPICIPACRKPRKPVNGHIDGGLYTVGSKITYSCKLGYNLSGPRSRICRKTHEWSDTAPLCEPNRLCVDPGPPENGYRSFIDDIGSVRQRETGNIPPLTKIRYGCHFPYKLKGSNFRTCQLNGSNTGDQPSCVPDPVPACPPVNLQSYGEHHRSISIVYQRDDWSSSNSAGNVTFSPGTRAEITCFAPFVLEGSMSRLSCSDNGTWERQEGEEIPKCVNVTSCPRLPPNPGLRISHHFKTSNGSVSLNSSGEDVIEAGLIPVGTTVTYACNNGVLNGKATRECLEGGKWSGYQPDCVKGCKDPGKPRHSTREAWIGPEATQQEKNLTADILRSTINRSRFPTGTVLQFECVDNNFFLRGIGRRVCMPNGRWSSPVNPRCLPKCGVFPKVVTAARGSRADLPVPESWPWHAVIKRRVHSAGPWTVQCAGAYIGHNIVVTVAQCVTFSSTVLPFQPYEIQVGLGINPSGGILQEHEVNELIVHTDFDPILHDYDIALLVLMSEVRLDPRGQLWPACLSGDPEYKSPRSRSVVIGEKATSSAWTEHHAAYGDSMSRATGDDSTGLSRHSAPDVVANTDGNDAPEKKLPVRSDPEKTLKAVNLDIVRASKVITAQDEPTTKPEYSTLNNDSTVVATTQTRELTDNIHGPDKIEHFEVTREISTKCEQVFRETMVASRMICGLQAIFANKGSSTDTQCFERKGSPMVVIRPIRQRNRNRRRRVKARTPKRRRPRCACKSRKTRQARAIADDAYANHVLLYPQHQRAKRAQDHQVELQALDLKDTSSATHVWVLEGLSSWTARGSCRELEVNRYTVYLKVRAFTEWIALKRNELYQKGLLLPPN